MWLLTLTLLSVLCISNGGVSKRNGITGHPQLDHYYYFAGLLGIYCRKGQWPWMLVDWSPVFPEGEGEKSREWKRIVITEPVYFVSPPSMMCVLVCVSVWEWVCMSVCDIVESKNFNCHNENWNFTEARGLKSKYICINLDIHIIYMYINIVSKYIHIKLQVSKYIE